MSTFYSDDVIDRGKQIFEAETVPIGPLLGGFLEKSFSICKPSEIPTPGCRMLKKDPTDRPVIRVGNAKKRMIEFINKFVFTTAIEYLSSESPPDIGTPSGYLEPYVFNSMQVYACMSYMAYFAKKSTERQPKENIPIIIKHTRYLNQQLWEEAYFADETNRDPKFLDTGFYTVYYNKYHDGGHFVIAFRGTLFSTPSTLMEKGTSTMKTVYDDFQTNYSTYMNTEEGNDQYTKGMEIVKYLKETYKGKRITLTGHSKGGSLAYHIAQSTGCFSVLFNPYLQTPKSSRANAPPVAIYRTMYDFASLFYSLFQTGPNDAVIVVDGYKNFSSEIGSPSLSGMLLAHKITSFFKARETIDPTNPRRKKELNNPLDEDTDDVPETSRVISQKLS